MSWPHAPVHFRVSQGTFMVTAGTYLKQHLFDSDIKLRLVQRALIKIAREHEWQLEAWAIFSNHYHFIGSKAGDGDTRSLDEFLQELHSRTAIALNLADNQMGRQVWHNYWEKALTYERSYYARLNYVHHNAVKHRLVNTPNQYPYCSAAWFENTASPAQVAKIYSFPWDKLKIKDDF